MEKENQKTNYRPLIPEIMNKLYKNGFIKTFSLLLSLSISIYSPIEVFKSLDNYQMEIEGENWKTSSYNNPTEYNCNFSSFDASGSFYANGQEYTVSKEKISLFLKENPDAIEKSSRETV